MLQKSEKDNSYTENNIVFDHINTDKIEMRVNGYIYPQEDFKHVFSEDYSNAFISMKIILTLINDLYS